MGLVLSSAQVVNMKILITGASSLPGFRITLEAIDRGHEVIALYKKNPIPIDRSGVKKVRLDIVNIERLKNLLLIEKPDAIVHAAALGDVDQCEQNKLMAWNVNVRPVVNIASLATKFPFFLAYLSTDYVFDGKRGNYKEEDPPNPINYYGLTKLMGEISCMSAGINSAIVRASSIYGFGPGRMNFARFLIEKLEKNEPVKALVDQYTSPTQATLLAKAMLEIVEKKLTGIFHVAGERMSRYEFALKVADCLGLDKSLVQPIRMGEIKWFAKRPEDSSLNSNTTRGKLETEFSGEIALRLLKEEYQKSRGFK